MFCQSIPMKFVLANKSQSIVCNSYAFGCVYVCFEGVEMFSFVPGLSM